MQNNTHPSLIQTLDRRQLLALAGAVGLSHIATPAFAQQWPSKSIRFVVPFAPGGSSEIVARSTAAELSKTIGQSVFVDNKPGAAGNIAMSEVARAEDHHTIILGHIGTLAVNPYIFPKLPYNVEKDFKPISLLAKVPSLYVVNPTLPVKSIKELIEYAKAHPENLSYGSAGNGSAGQLAFEYLKLTSGFSMLHVPYRGTGPMMTDLLSGRVGASAIGAAAVIPFIKSGKLRCIATGSSTRIPQLPDVPTVAEQGFPGFEMTQWYGMLAPANFSKGEVDLLATETSKAVRSPSSMERLHADAAEVIGNTPAQFSEFIAQEQARWKQVIAKAQIKAD